MKKPTLEQIAAECNVTKGLVSRALGGKNNVSDSTREKIIRKATELGYDTSKLKAYKVSSTHVLLISSSRILFKEDFWQPIITSISSTLSRNNLIMEYFVFDEDKIEEIEVMIGCQKSSLNKIREEEIKSTWVEDTL